MQALADVYEHSFKGSYYSDIGKNKKVSNQTYKMYKIVQYLVTSAIKN